MVLENLIHSGSAYIPARIITSNSMSRTKNKNGLLMSSGGRRVVEVLDSIEDAASIKVPCLVTSKVVECFILLTLKGSSLIILSNPPSSNGASMYS